MDKRHDDNKTSADKAKGGKARADALTSTRRREIAQQAATARWHAEIPQATHEGDLHIGKADIVIKAAVLPNGKRLLSQGTFLQAIGRSRTPKAGTGGLSTVDGLPFFLQAEQLKPFISEELRLSTTPIMFRLKSGQRSVGYDAELLAHVCEVYLKFRDACRAAGDEVPAQYRHIVEACDVLMRGFARVGIVALVDEATGFQEVRDRLALHKILDKFLRKEFAAWAKRFPDTYYMEIFRLRKWQWKGMSVNRPQAVATYTKDIVYKRLAPGILEELEKRNPVDEKGNRVVKHHQWLTPDIGHPALAQHIHAVTTLMRASTTWDEFKRMLDRSLPKRGENLSFNFEEDSTAPSPPSSRSPSASPPRGSRLSPSRP
jgi:hypothetical protein